MLLLSLLLMSLFFFAFGTIIGSFINVMIYRSLDSKTVKKGETWYKGRSRCDHCHKVIAWYDNIPLLSYVILGGKCRHCRAAINITHPTVELLTGLLFVWWYGATLLFFQLTRAPFNTLQPVFWLAVGLLLLYIFLTDIRYYLIPDTAVLFLTLMVVVYRVALVVSGIMQLHDFLLAIACMVGAVLFFGALWLGTKGKGIGFGDVKLMVPLGLLLGWPNALVMLFVSFILGAGVGIVLLVSGKRKFGQIVPFGPFLVMGTWVSLVWGDQLFSWYLSSFWL